MFNRFRDRGNIFSGAAIDRRKLAVLAGVLIVFVLLTNVLDRCAPKPPRVLADMSPRCANKKLPSYYVSDPRIVRERGGKTLLYVDGADETFALTTPGPVPSGGTTAGPAADGSTPSGATSSTAEPTGGSYGDGTIGMTTVVRPDAGTLLLAVAQNERDRETGLMCVTSMAPRVGMIFVFAAEGLENFWMKDTLMPLDMIFVSASGRVTGVAANVPASRIDQSEATLARRSGVGRFVIELNAGEAARDDIRPGAMLQISHLVSMD